MSTSHPHFGTTRAPDAAAAYHDPDTNPSSDEFPFTLRALREHLERLGYRAEAGTVGGEDVREMQARVAALRESLPHGPGQEPPPERDDAHLARTRYYERRIQAALAGMASQLDDDSLGNGRISGLDVTNRAWLDERFEEVRDHIEEAIGRTSSAPQDDICAELETARQRLNVMERKLDNATQRQEEVQRNILRRIDSRMSAQPADDTAPTLKALDQRVAALQEGFDQAMTELSSIRTGTNRLVVRASTTVARQTARATAHHVARAVREAAPEQRFARLEEGLSGCMEETRSLRQEASAMHQTLEHGIEDLRGRINEVTLICRKALAAQPQGSGDQDAPSAPVQAPHATRHQAANGRLARYEPRGQSASRCRAQNQPGRGTSLISRLGFAVVIGLLIAASFAMLYAQLSGSGWRLPTLSERDEAPASTSVRPSRDRVADRIATIPRQFLSALHPA